MGTEPRNRSYIASLPPFFYNESVEVLGDTKVKERIIKKKNSKTRKEDSILQMSKNPKASNTIHSLPLLLQRIKTLVSYYIKLYFQNCITGSPETMDVVLGFIKENKFRSS